ncbi:BQ5605_C006g04015 [Microbotryum silenes-dioicae]|uniref:BQ5605_C006g04015 protein n=1 Tax=Microbotryum silenes-dioicae TaxID=796604 RepID=A0A2X0M8Q0_9BASI|nr:BQ5605_C006g04015 [Microbotryum silenes-dioicae]
MTKSPTAMSGSGRRCRLTCSACRTLAAANASRTFANTAFRSAIRSFAAGTSGKSGRLRDVGNRLGERPRTTSNGDLFVEALTLALIANSMLTRCRTQLFCCLLTTARKA